jgi:hypothetical protein
MRRGEIANMARAKGRPSTLSRVAAFCAVLALALNVIALPVLARQLAPLDAFGQPICSEHANTASADEPLAPADDGSVCQFCCTIPLAAAPLSPALAPPSAVEWKQPAVAAVTLLLPSPSRHFLGPPRGPPRA